MQILKLGGSVVTHRSPGCAFQHAQVERLAGELRTHVGGLVVTHGAGSFRRAVVPLFDRPLGVSEDQGIMVRRVQQALRDLQDLVADALVTAGIPVVNLDAPSLFALEGSQVAVASLDTVRFHCNRGRLPLLSPGLVPEATGGWSVLSSDRIAAELALGLSALRVVWATDVDGIVGCHDQGEVTVLSSLRPEDRARVASRDTDAIDPTGGMTGKLEAAFRLAERGMPSYIVNGTRPSRVKRALQGDPGAGTVVLAAAANT